MADEKCWLSRDVLLSHLRIMNSAGRLQTDRQADKSKGRQRKVVVDKCVDKSIKATGADYKIGIKDSLNSLKCFVYYFTNPESEYSYEIYFHTCHFSS